MLMNLEVFGPSPHLEVLPLLQVPLLAIFSMFYVGYFAVTIFEDAGYGGLWTEMNHSTIPGTFPSFSLTSLGNNGVDCFVLISAPLLHPVPLSSG